MKQFTTYFKLRAPLFISAVSLLYMVLNTVFVDNRSQFFNSLSTDAKLMLYTVTALISWVGIAVSCEHDKKRGV